MKKKRINLFGSRVEYLQIEKKFYYVRIASFVLFFVFLFIFFLTNLILLVDKKQFDALFVQKKILLENQQANINEEAKIRLIFNKHQEIQSYLENDARFLPYYQLLISTLKTATPEPSLLFFKIDKEKNAEFTLGFTDINQMVKFLNFIEDENFINNFESLVLNSFSFTQSKTELSFKGKFVSLKNENF